ncbi:hypothetical protein D3C81_2178880 [compost metagenome]
MCMLKYTHVFEVIQHHQTDRTAPTKAEFEERQGITKLTNILQIKFRLENDTD